MKSSLMTALAADAAPSVYGQACTLIQQYTSWVEGQSLPSGSGNYSNWSAAEAVLTQLKTDAMQWINQIFPDTLQFPATFALRGQGVTAQLTTLIALVGQLDGNGPPPAALTQQIQELIGQMLPAVNGLQTQSSALAASLNGFSRAMVSDDTSSAAEVQALLRDLSSERGIVASASGQLQHERSKSCPSQSTEQSLTTTINQANAQIAAIENLLPIFDEAAEQTGQCSQSLSYLANYWMALAADLTGCAQALQGATSVPTSLLPIDLKTVQTQWQQTLTFLQQAGSASAA